MLCQPAQKQKCNTSPSAKFHLLPRHGCGGEGEGGRSSSSVTWCTITLERATLIFHIKSSWQQQCLCPDAWIILTVGEQLTVTWYHGSQTGSTGLLSTAVEVHITRWLEVLGHLRAQHTWLGQDVIDPVLGRVATQVVSLYTFHPPAFCFFYPQAVWVLGVQLFLTGFFHLWTRRKRDLQCQQTTKKSSNTPGERQSVRDAKISDILSEIRTSLPVY